MYLCKFCNFENPDGLDLCDQCHAPLHGIDDAETTGNTKQPCHCDVGQVIGMRYIITSQSAKVSFGDVFGAEDAADDSDVSLYLVPDDVIADEHTLDQLKAAVCKITSLPHEHLLSLLDADLEGDRKFLVYEKSADQSLADHIVSGPLNAEETLRIFTQAGSALDYLHSRNVVHGDVAAENIIIDESGAVKLAYPAISKIIKDAAAIDGASNQLEGKTIRRNDIYSFASCMYHSLGGHIEDGRFLSLGILNDKQNTALRNALSRDSLCRHATCAELLEEMGVEAGSVDWETVKLYSVSVSADNSGQVFLPARPGAKFEFATEIEIKAVAATNYHFVSWAGTAVEAGKVANPDIAQTTLTVEDNYSLNAIFSINTHVLNISSSGGGFVSEPVESDCQFEHGCEVAVRAAADEHCHFTGWIGSAVDDGKVADPDNPVTTVKVEGDYSLEANFEVDRFSLDLSACDGGQVSIGETDSTSCDYEYGSTVAIAACPDENYHFVEWAGLAVDAGMVEESTLAETTVTVQGDYSLSAVFEIDSHAFCLSSSGGGSVVEPDQGVREVAHGCQVQIEAKSDKNYHFVGWTGSAVDKGKVQEIGNPVVSLEIDDDYSLEATFTINRYPLTLKPSDGGRIETDDADVVDYEYGTKVLIAATADENFHFVEWAGSAVDSRKVQAPFSPKTTVTIDGEYSVYAIFAIERHLLNLSSGGGGSVTEPSEGFSEYDYGRQVFIKVAADENHHFVEWSGPAVDEGKIANKHSAETSIKIDGDISLEAVFAIDQHCLSLSSGDGGVVSTAADQAKKYNHGRQLEITATADENHHFVEWLGLAVDSGWVADPKSANTSITAAGEVNVEAVFAIDKKTLTVTASDDGLVTLPGCGQYSYDYGQQVIIECYANLKCHFVGWAGSAVDNGKVADPASPKTTVNIEDDCDVYAVFAKDRFVIKSIDFVKSGFDKPKAKVVAAALLIAIILTPIIMGLKKSSIEKNVLPDQWLNAQQKAKAGDFDTAIATAGNILEVSENFAEDQNIQETLAVWEIQHKAQMAWLEVEQLIGQSKYEAATLQSLELVREYPDSNFAEQAKNEIPQLEMIIALENRISKAAEEKDYKKAMDMVLAVLNDSPDSGRAALVKIQIDKQLQSKADDLKDSLIRSAERFVNNEHWGKAVNNYSRALEIAPADVKLKEKLSLCRHNMYLADGLAADNNKDHESAVRSYSLALSFRQIDTTAEKLDSARTALKRAITLKQLSQMAANAMQSREYAVAITIYEEILESYPAAEGIADLLATAKHDLHLSEALSLKEAGKLPEAIVLFNEALSFKNVESTQLQHDSVVATLKEMQQAYNKQTQMSNWLIAAKEAESSGDQGWGKALGFYEKAANAGSPEAMVALGEAFYQGSGVEVDTQRAVQWFKKAVDQEYAPAYCSLGIAYSEGKGKQKNISAAFECFKKGADSGSSRAMYYLSRAYHEGQGTKRDLAVARDWLIKSADAGDEWAMHNLAMLYRNGVGVKKDLDEAVRWYEKAANAGDADAMYNLGVIYFKGDGVEKDITKGMWWLTRSAENGNIDAVLRLGLAYHDGIGVAVNYPAAIKWLTNAAQHGSVNAMGRLGHMYQRGLGVNKAPEKALKWFTEAAENGCVKCMTRLGIIYFEGSDVKQDYAKAVKWFSTAADAGNVESMYYMGVVYKKGLGVDADKAGALEWFTKAAKAGHYRAMHELAVAYADGQGTSPDPKTAFQWFEKAANAGSQKAIFRLAIMYEEGTGVEQDSYESVRWFQKAARLGNEAAKERLAELNEIW